MSVANVGQYSERKVENLIKSCLLL